LIFFLGETKIGVSWSDSTHRFCKDLRDPICGGKNPWRDEFDSSLYSEKIKTLNYMRTGRSSTEKKEVKYLFKQQNPYLNLEK
jgi:hypothetical protein